MSKLSLAAVVTVGLVVLNAASAFALPSFKKAFEARYVKPLNNEEFTKAAKKAGCNVCHVKGEEKETRNAYGDSLAELIEGDAADRVKKAEETNGESGKDEENAKLLEELEKAFNAAESKASPAGPTFGELLKSGKLPIGP